MQSVLDKAPLKGFARKAYFWSELKDIKKRLGLKEPTGYKYLKTEEIERAVLKYIEKEKKLENRWKFVENAPKNEITKKAYFWRAIKNAGHEFPGKYKDYDADDLMDSYIDMTRDSAYEDRKEKELYGGRSLLELRTPQRGDILEFKINQIPKKITILELAEELKNFISPYVTTESFIRFYSSENEKFYNMTRKNGKNVTLQKDAKLKAYANLAAEIIDSRKKQEYGPEYIDIIQIIPTTEKNPELNRLYNGFYNCAVGPVIYHMAQLTQNKDVKGKVNKLKKLNKKIIENGDGADSSTLQEIANISKFTISVVDRLQKAWKTFEVQKSRGTILMEVNGNHLVSKYEEQLKQVNNENAIFSVKYEEVEFNPFKNKEIMWYNDLSDLSKQFPTADVVISKGDLKAIITNEVIYKKKFHQCEEYPDAFGDGGVGKMKFLEQNPEFKNYKPNAYDTALLESEFLGIYYRSKESNPNNFKYDHNHSYKSFKNSGIFKGFPVIEGCVRINENVSSCERLFDKHGMFYIEGDDHTGWYPIEIVKHNYEKYGVDPIVREMLFGSKTFDIDETKFTNSQFRCFIGKCFSQFGESTWRTDNYSEFLRARYILRDNITSLDINDGIYTIGYKKSSPQWCMPIIYAYVLRHQKHIIMEHLSLLDQTPVHICVDGIELERQSSVFDIGPNPGQWKYEEINMNLDQKPFDMVTEKNERMEDVPFYSDIKEIIDIIDKNQYVHISGPAGNGKSFLLKKLSKVYKTSGICATTHQAVRLLGDAKTYYAEFNLCNELPIYKKPIYFIDECSMLSAEHLEKIISKVPDAKIIIFGDFIQLPVVEGTPIDNHEIYDMFYEHILTQNYRQKEDPEFYELCNMLRHTVSIEDAKKIRKTLNKRVKPAQFLTKDDIYIAGVNCQVDKINNNFSLVDGAKVIATKTEMNYVNGLKGIWTNGVVKWNDGTITIDPKNIALNYASTVHKAQGSTYLGNVVINPTKLFEKNHLYVALTRAVRFSNIYLTEKITMDILEKTCNIELEPICEPICEPMEAPPDVKFYKLCNLLSSKLSAKKANKVIDILNERVGKSGKIIIDPSKLTDKNQLFMIMSGATELNDICLTDSLSIEKLL